MSATASSLPSSSETSSAANPARRSRISSSRRERGRTESRRSARSWQSSGCFGSREHRGPATLPSPSAGRHPGRLTFLRGALRRRLLLILRDDEIGDDLDRGLVALGAERGQAHRLAHLPLDLGRDVGVLGEELAGVLAALAELVALVGEPRAALADDLHVDADVEEAALLRDPEAVHDVELALAERRRDLVLDDLHPCPRADHVGAVLQVLDLADIQTDRRVELQRAAPGGGLGVAEHHADLLAELVDEDRGS